MIVGYFNTCANEIFADFENDARNGRRRRAGAGVLGALFALVTVIALLGWAPEASAYSQYTPSKGGQGNCASCHGDFNGNAPYVSLQDADAATWPSDTMSEHSTVMLQGECAACHGSGPKFPVLLNSSQGVGGALNLACMGCHGRPQDANTVAPSNGPGWGAALRQVHFRANRDVVSLDDGVTIINTQVCVNCHGDSDPAAFTTAPENATPFPNYYTDPTVSVSPPTNPCTAETIYGTLGLDNDGDGTIDANDTDCQVNVPPVADAGGPYTATVGTPVNLDGSGSTDANGDTLTFTWEFTSVPAGSALTLGTGSITQDGTAAASFTPDRNGSYDVQVTVDDGKGGIDTALVTISTTNNPPVADANVGAPYSGQNGALVTLTGSGSDPDGDLISAYSWTLTARPAGSSATLTTPTSASTSFTIDVSGTYQATLVVTDEFGLDSAASTASISTSNTLPVASFVGAPYTASIGNVVNIQATASDPDIPGSLGQSLSYSFSFTSVPTTPVASALTTADIVQDGSAFASFTPDVAGIYTVQVIANDTVGNSAPVTTNVDTQNTVPVANAGNDITAAVNDVVQLNGSASTDGDGDPLTYAWSLVSGPDTPTLSPDATAVNPTFTATSAGTYTWQLVVSDPYTSSAPDQVNVVVGSSNTAPIADAGGPYSAVNGGTVNLDGTASSDPDGDQLSYSWAFTSRPVGSTATLAGAATATPSFVIDVSGTYQVQLTVTDNGSPPLNNSATATVSTINSAPTANAGSPQTVLVGQTVTLDGSGSNDVDGDPLTYSWSFNSVPANSTLTTANISQSGVPGDFNATFVPDQQGDYIVQLIVNDGALGSTPSTVTVTTNNSAPTANAGPDQPSVPLGGTVNLDGSGSSDPDGDSLTYAWSFTSVPAGSALTTADIVQSGLADDPLASFTTDVKGTYTVQLIVTDDAPVPQSSAADTMNATVANSAPTANAGLDQNIVDGGLVTLDGSGSSDPDGDPLTYNWAFTALPVGSAAALDTTDPVHPTFTADVGGTYTVRLIVNDGTVNSAADSMNVVNTLSVATPNIVLSPATFDFGSALVGTTQTGYIAIQSNGDAILNVSGLSISGPDAANFVVVGPATPFSVIVGRQTLVEIAYTPDAALVDSASLDVASDDPDTPVASAPLAGTGLAGQGDINLASLTLDIGDVEVGATGSGNLVIQNVGTADLTVTGLTVTGSTDFTIGTAVPFVIAAGYQNVVPVSFTPSATGPASGNLAIDSDDVDEPTVNVALGGNGTSTPTVADINLSPATLDFGSPMVGSTVRGDAYIQNVGTGDLNVSGLAITGSTDFQILSGSATPFVIRPGRQVKVRLSFTPSVGGAIAGGLQVTSDDPVDPTIALPLSGSGSAGVADVNLPVTSYDFGSILVGQNQNGFLAIQNVGTSDLTVTSLGLTGSADFSLVNPPATPFVIRGGRETKVRVDYGPTAPGAASATLTVGSDDVDEPSVAVALSGAGLSGVADINLPATSMDFGNVEVGETVVDYVAIQNVGSSDLTVTGLTMSGSTDFSTSQATPFVVGSNRQVMVPVAFAPTATGAIAGTMTVASDDVVDPSLAVSLAGNGTSTSAIPDINLPVVSYNFGDVYIGKSATGYIAIQNVGTADLTVSGLTLSGSGDYAIGSSAPLVVAPSRQVVVPVTFTPTVTGAAAGTLTIDSDDPDEASLAVSLSANGLQGTADINLPAVTFNFGDVVVGTTQSGYIAIQNVGTAELTVTGLSFSGSADLVLRTAAPFTVAAGRQVMVRVDFTPSATGPVTGTLTVDSDDPDEPSLTVDVLGNGAPAA